VRRHSHPENDATAGAAAEYDEIVALLLAALDAVLAEAPPTPRV
jgi:hypothetical protein